MAEQHLISSPILPHPDRANAAEPFHKHLSSKADLDPDPSLDHEPEPDSYCLPGFGT